MIRGIGVDMVDIQEIQRYWDEMKDHAFFRHTFTPAEQEAASRNPRPIEYYATAFVVAEAVSLS